ncbi:MAG TPA: TonB family protein [Thermoanaerobaculia bacterium]|nr:TonB family protein [Thermoanaerobaculia bacterium]
MPRTDSAVSKHRGGVVAIVVLSLIFFALLFALLFMGGKSRQKPPQEKTELYVIAPRLRIRTQARSGAPIVTTVSKNDKLLMIQDAGVWVEVRTPDGITGWAERALLSRAAEHDRRIARAKAISRLPPLEGIVEERTPLYAGPGVFYPLVGELAPEAKVKVFTRDHDFYAIEQGEEIVYAAIDAINLSTPGIPQINVAAARPEGSTSTTETAQPQIAETLPMLAPEGRPESVRPDDIGVYPVVPGGGTQPQIVDRVTPRYPRGAREANIAGSVVIRGIVRKDGSIEQVEILKDLPYGLGESARDAVEHWRFLPATYQGDPIDVYYTVTVNFRLSD